MAYSKEISILRLLVAKAYGISETLHELEAVGIELTAKQDDRWAQFTKVSETLREYYMSEDKGDLMSEYFRENVPN